MLAVKPARSAWEVSYEGRSTRVPTGVCLVESAGVPQHVRVGLDFESSGFAGSVNQLLKVGHCHIGDPRSDRNRKGDLFSVSRYRRRSARSSRPVSG